VGRVKNISYDTDKIANCPFRQSGYGIHLGTEKRLRVKNIFSSIPEPIQEEIFEDLLKTDSIRIERILSRGQSSPAQGWFDQAENEWVIVLEGSGILLFEDGREITLTRGDYLHIPAHVRHRVTWTDPDRVTVWLAVFYSD
jgi:cupin 2 domain-containing protein